MTSPDGLVTSSAYDPANRLTAVGYSDGTTQGVGSSTSRPANASATIVKRAPSGTAGLHLRTNDGRLANIAHDGAGPGHQLGYNADSSTTTVKYPNGEDRHQAATTTPSG